MTVKRLSPGSQSQVQRFREWLALCIATTSWRTDVEAQTPAGLAQLLGVDESIVTLAATVRARSQASSDQAKIVVLRVQVGPQIRQLMEEAAKRWSTTSPLLLLTIVHYGCLLPEHPKLLHRCVELPAPVGLVHVIPPPDLTSQQARNWERIHAMVPAALLWVARERARRANVNLEDYVRSLMSLYFQHKLATPEMLYQPRQAFLDMRQYQLTALPELERSAYGKTRYFGDRNKRRRPGPRGGARYTPPQYPIGVVPTPSLRPAGVWLGRKRRHSLSPKDSP